MPAKPNERQYRALSAPLAQPDEGKKRFFPDSEYEVQGYASTFNDPYPLWTDPWTGATYYEVIDPDAFRDADMSDVIMQFDHEGRVYARMSNGTLIVIPDEHGLFIAADLGRSQNARDLHEEIKAELVTRMSWAFTVAADEFDRDTHTTTITRVKKVFDVSAVSLPADPNTEISARNMLHGEMERTREELARRKRSLAIAEAQIQIANVRKV